MNVVLYDLTTYGSEISTKFLKEMAAPVTPALTLIFQQFCFGLLITM
jgi:hypothetical protein